MAKQKISINGRDIRRYINTLKEKRKNIDKDFDFFMRYMAQEAEDYCKSICPVGLVDHAGGHLVDSISATYNPATKRITVKAGSYWAIFVEYGTGVIGASSPHPEPGDWSYGSDPDGWWYPITADVYEQMLSMGMNVAKNKNGDCFAHTHGMESRPFMYKTRQYIKELIRKEAKEFFT